MSKISQCCRQQCKRGVLDMFPYWVVQCKQLSVIAYFTLEPPNLTSYYIPRLGVRVGSALA